MKIVKIRDKVAERVVSQLEKRGRVNIKAVEDTTRTIPIIERHNEVPPNHAEIAFLL